VQADKGEFAPEGAIVCYLFGRYCCANKFAGESDLFEEKTDIAAHYPIDEQRLVILFHRAPGAKTVMQTTEPSRSKRVRHLLTEPGRPAVAGRSRPTPRPAQHREQSLPSTHSEPAPWAGAAWLRVVSAHRG
jgi:hypothetical protein